MASDSAEFPRVDLEGQVVLVTAAARGLGRACALACAHAGDRNANIATAATIPRNPRRCNIPASRDNGNGLDEPARALP